MSIRTIGICDVCNKSFVEDKNGAEESTLPPMLRMIFGDAQPTVGKLHRCHEAGNLDMCDRCYTEFHAEFDPWLEEQVKAVKQKGDDLVADLKQRHAGENTQVRALHSVSGTGGK